MCLSALLVTLVANSNPSVVVRLSKSVAKLLDAVTHWGRRRAATATMNLKYAAAHHFIPVVQDTPFISGLAGSKEFHPKLAFRIVDDDFPASSACVYNIASFTL